MDPVSTLADYAAVGALVAAAMVLFSDREGEAAMWILKGTVAGGAVGLLVLLTGGVS